MKPLSKGQIRAAERLLDGVDIVGSVPTISTVRLLFVFYTATPTEARLLEAFEAIRLHGADFDYITVPITEKPDHEGLVSDVLFKTLKKEKGPMTIVPVGVAWKPKSERQQNWRAIMGWTNLLSNNRRQKRMLKRRPERCAIIIGESATLEELTARHQKHADHDNAAETINDRAIADYIAQQAALTIERDARSVTGETVKYPRFVARSLWGRRNFQAQLYRIAIDSGRTYEDVQMEARRCIKELLPNARAAHISAAWALSRTVCRLGYEDDLIYDKEKMAALRRLAMERPLALLFTHKTHIDGIAMILATRDESFPLVHMIGGDNLAFAGAGYLMRRAGSIFIRRKIDSPVYKVVMRHYLSFLMEKRFPVCWSLEGTRSRNGKLMPPRFGILKYVVEAAAKENMRDLTIVPVSIYYDLIAELSDYAHEQRGGVKRKESLAWLSDYLRTLRKPLGRISLAIGDPIAVDATRLAPSVASTQLKDEETFSLSLQKTAFEASVNANAVTPITPSALFMLILTGAAPKALTQSEIISRMLALRDWALARALPVTAEIESLQPKRIRAIAKSILEIGLVEEFDGGPEPVFSIAEGKQFEASYYRNTAIHFFITKAITELALVKAAQTKHNPQEAFWAETDALRDLFKFEFFYPAIELFKADIHEEMQRCAPDWDERLTAGGALDLLEQMEPLVAHAALRPFAEAYLVVADVLLDTRLTDALGDQKAVVDAALRYAQQALLQRRITSEESIGKLMFENGHTLAVHRGLTKADDITVNANRRVFRDELDAIVNRLRMIADHAESKRYTPTPNDPPQYENGASNGFDAQTKSASPHNA